MSAPSVAEQKKHRLLEMAVSAVVLAIWGVTLLVGILRQGGIGHWLVLSVGPVAVLQTAFAGWEYLGLKRISQRD